MGWSGRTTTTNLSATAVQGSRSAEDLPSIAPTAR